MKSAAIVAKKLATTHAKSEKSKIICVRFFLVRYDIFFEIKHIDNVQYISFFNILLNCNIFKSRNKYIIYTCIYTNTF